MVDMEIKRGDLLPAFVVDLTDGVDANTGLPVPVDLSSVTSIKVNAWRGNVTLFSRTVSNPTGPAALAGTVTMPWQSGDTSVWADLYIEVEVTWPGTKPQTFPRSGYIVVRVSPDLT